MAPATGKPLRPGPLDGLKILDFTIMMAGPLCTRLLADVGAEIIKVEAPEGDHIRTRPPLRDGNSTYFGQLNCGKESIALDLKQPAALAIARRLAAAADVVVENFRPGVMKRLGLDHATLARDNPGLVYCSISGFGQTGPAAAKPAYAPVIHAASGFDLANLYYQDGQERPAKTGIFIADVLGGVYAFGAIQAALIERQRTGQGQAIDVSLMDCMLNLMVYECQEAQFPSERRRPLYKPLFARDGFVIVAPVSQNNFERLTEAVGHPEWKADPRFATIAAREQNWDLLMSLVEQWTRERPALECETVLMDAGIPTSRYLTIGEAMKDPHVAARGSLATVHDGAGAFDVPNAPFQFSGGGVGARPFVAALGANGADILRRLLGCGDGEIEALKRSGALHG